MTERSEGMDVPLERLVRQLRERDGLVVSVEDLRLYESWVNRHLTSAGFAPDAIGHCLRDEACYDSLKEWLFDEAFRKVVQEQQHGLH